jgi:hypothetical protein
MCGRVAMCGTSLEPSQVWKTEMMAVADVKGQRSSSYVLVLCQACSDLHETHLRKALPLEWPSPSLSLDNINLESFVTRTAQFAYSCKESVLMAKPMHEATAVSQQRPAWQYSSQTVRARQTSGSDMAPSYAAPRLQHHTHEGHEDRGPTTWVGWGMQLGAAYYSGCPTPKPSASGVRAYKNQSFTNFRSRCCNSGLGLGFLVML